jgi:hypothetical protein
MSTSYFHKVSFHYFEDYLMMKLTLDSQDWIRKNIFNLPQVTNKCWTLWPCIGPKAEKNIKKYHDINVRAFRSNLGPNNKPKMVNVKSTKGNECNQHKSTAANFSSSLSICLIHIFSSDTQACFALGTSHNMSSKMLHTPLYP